MTLSHLTDDGEIHMVDISEKEGSVRTAQAAGTVIFPEGVLGPLLEKGPPKGDVFATARLAGIQAAKQTPQFIPLAHPIQLSHASIRLSPAPADDRIEIESTVKAKDATGVEMEALTAVNAAALTLYDMCKSEHKGIKITGIKLLKKTGGSSGDWSHEADA